MSAFNRTLNGIAASLRLLSKAVENWLWIAAILCLLSPISPHVSFGPFSGHACDYVGTRGIVSISEPNCPIVAIIDTRSEQIWSWEVPSW